MLYGLLETSYIYQKKKSEMTPKTPNPNDFTPQHCLKNPVRKQRFT